MAKYTFRDKVVIITGSSGGIGKEVAIQLIGEGAKVVLNGRNPEKLEQAKEELVAMGGEILAVQGDLTDPEIANHLIEKTVREFGRIDVLINNAGVSIRGNFAELDPHTVKKVFDINVMGSVSPGIYAIPHLRASKGSLVFVSSLVAVHGLPGNGAYSSSKMALRAFAEAIRIEEAETGIHVGLVLVGLTEIDPGKTTMDSKGQPVELKKRVVGKEGVQSKEQVARSILKNIKKRKFISTLTPLGKITSFLQRMWPSLLEWIIIKNLDKFKEGGK